ncbi:cell cycle control protein 50C-like isoform X2 [Rhinolophus ferrumequinum]|uniref:cell cycle control protein 50C-like isoform X2 n=1 Tax=Rhinolophus ferrumequinum TaxID=59479 RepID=UPI00140F9A4D|nr:cell cycle control protein 50C-like isoform X2 [Rhinolophus ferrumequinum]
MDNTSQISQSRLPDSTALKQQQLPAYKLQLSATKVLTGFFITGAFCLGMGILLILSAKSTKEIEGNIYMYYKLYGFYQNLNPYVVSRSNNQLMGRDVKDVGNCDPFSKSHNGTPIAPCGAIANSMFNDTIILSYNLNSSIHIKVPMLSIGIAWWTDKYIKFQNPSLNLPSTFAGTTKPPYWPKPVYELDEENAGNNGFLNEDFIVWMRTAAFPTFKKLYRRLYRIQYFTEGLPAGNYSFNITYNFPVTRFQGEKSVVLSTLTWSGGSSLFLGLTYTVTGAVTWLASFSMMAIHLMLNGRKTVFPQQKSEDSKRKAENTEMDSEVNGAKDV